MEHGIVNDIAICIVAAWVLGVLFNALKQPLILAYLVAGFALGPHGFRLVEDKASVETISSIGLVLLLFLIGLEIDLRSTLRAGKAILITGAVQILGSVAVAWLWFRQVGPASTGLEALYLAIAAALSSTVIIVKLLHDRHDLSTVPGRVTLGVLVLQDLFAILFLAIQPNLKTPALAVFGLSAAKVVLLIGVAFSVSRFVLPSIFNSVARLPELVLVGALAWCFALAGFASRLGLSREMGALVAGVALSTFPYTLDVTAKVTSIRDFFVTLYFVALGMIVPFPTWSYVRWTLAVTGLVIGTRALTALPALYRLRFGLRGSLLPTLNLCQISELSLVILALGRKAGDVSEESLSVAAFSFSLLAVLSTYGILKSDTLVPATAGLLRRLGLRDLDDQEAPASATEHRPRLFLLGFHWAASSLLAEIRRQRPDLVDQIRVVDFSPTAIGGLRRKGVPVIYGDITHREVLLHAGLGEAEIIVCTLPNMVLKGASNLQVVRHLREINPKAHIVMHAERLAEVAALYAAGASHVVLPRLIEAREWLDVIDAAQKDLLVEKRRQLETDLINRDEVLP